MDITPPVLTDEEIAAKALPGETWAMARARVQGKATSDYLKQRKAPGQGKQPCANGRCGFYCAPPAVFCDDCAADAHRPCQPDGVPLLILQHSSSHYGPRTYENAKSCALTAAFAVDFGTAGERLTHKAAGQKYVGISVTDEPIAAARQLYKALRYHDAHTLNIAGNGIYTLAKHGWSQAEMDAWLYEVLKTVCEHWKVDVVRSGGQTGVDLAGLAAAYALGISAIGLLPRGYLQRSADGVDREQTEQFISTEIRSAAAALRQNNWDPRSQQG